MGLRSARGLVARILVGPRESEDPICKENAHGPLPEEPDLPGPPVLGFLACAAIARPPSSSMSSRT